MVEWDGMENVIKEEEEAMRQKLLALELAKKKAEEKKPGK